MTLTTDPQAQAIDYSDDWFNGTDPISGDPNWHNYIHTDNRNKDGEGGTFIIKFPYFNDTLDPKYDNIDSYLQSEGINFQDTTYLNQYKAMDDSLRVLEDDKIRKAKRHFFNFPEEQKNKIESENKRAGKFIAYGWDSQQNTYVPISTIEGTNLDTALNKMNKYQTKLDKMAEEYFADGVWWENEDAYNIHLQEIEEATSKANLGELYIYQEKYEKNEITFENEFNKSLDDYLLYLKETSPNKDEHLQVSTSFDANKVPLILDRYRDYQYIWLLNNPQNLKKWFAENLLLNEDNFMTDNIPPNEQIHPEVYVSVLNFIREFEDIPQFQKKHYKELFSRAEELITKHDSKSIKEIRNYNKDYEKDNQSSNYPGHKVVETISNVGSFVVLDLVPTIGVIFGGDGSVSGDDSPRSTRFDNKKAWKLYKRIQNQMKNKVYKIKTQNGVVMDISTSRAFVNSGTGQEFLTQMFRNKSVYKGSFHHNLVTTIVEGLFEDLEKEYYSDTGMTSFSPEGFIEWLYTHPNPVYSSIDDDEFWSNYEILTKWGWNAQSDKKQFSNYNYTSSMGVDVNNIENYSNAKTSIMEYNDFKRISDSVNPQGWHGDAPWERMIHKDPSLLINYYQAFRRKQVKENGSYSGNVVIGNDMQTNYTLQQIEFLLNEYFGYSLGTEEWTNLHYSKHPKNNEILPSKVNNVWFEHYNGFQYQGGNK